jgi:hypothetical protein
MSAARRDYEDVFTLTLSAARVPVVWSITYARLVYASLVVTIHVSL